MEQCRTWGTWTNNDEYITGLLEEWNLVGLPYDTPVAKEDLTVYYNDTDYTWQQAVNESIILDFIYNWDTISQNYMSADVLNPDYGYWIYAYYECTLKK